MSEPDKTRLQEIMQDYKVLTEVLQEIGSTMEVDATLQRVMAESLKLCDADQASILLIKPGEQPEAVTLIREGGDKQEKLDHYLNNLLAGWISLHNKPLLTDNLAEVFSSENVKEKYADISSIMGVPLVLEEAVIGVINLIKLADVKKLGERELQLMTLLAKPCARFIRNAKLHEELFAETKRLQYEVEGRYAMQGIIGQSPKMQEVFALLDRVIPTEAQVLLEGETGTGKERVARAIHYGGPRKKSPFVAIDCGALPAHLLESELFGYVRGAFTGASMDRKGLFETAHGGTIFLDEISNMPKELQSKLLRVLQEREFRPIGSTQVRQVDVRIIAAASADLHALIREGEFRKDLFYRLSVINVPLPPLRERAADIAVLAEHFLSRMNEKHNRSIKRFKPAAIKHLESHAWPGNVRELEHAVERAVVLSQGKQLGVEDFPFRESPEAIDEGLFRPRALQEAVTDLKREYVSRILQLTGGNQKEAAKLLQVQPSNLNRLMKSLNIKG